LVFIGPAPVRTFPPNDYGLYNMLGNVWEWVKGGTPAKRILRGGSFIDSVDGKFNHIVIVSTRQTNTGDSSASNIGFRCASSEDIGSQRLSEL
jgi:formylglycine-generating enzyme required for sulfatase activity